MDKLANCLILPLINAINQAAKVKGQYAYYAVCSIREEWPKKKCCYITVYNDSYDINTDRLQLFFNTAYYEIFHLYNPNNDNNIAISYSDYYMDEYNQFCKDIILEDRFFYQYHGSAVKWHLGR